MFSCDMDSRLISKRPQCLLPSRLPLLVLIKNLCLPENVKESEHDELLECIGRLRHSVSLLLLELIQVCILFDSILIIIIMIIIILIIIMIIIILIIIIIKVFGALYKLNALTK